MSRLQKFRASVYENLVGNQPERDNIDVDKIEDKEISSVITDISKEEASTEDSIQMIESSMKKKAFYEIVKKRVSKYPKYDLNGETSQDIYGNTLYYKEGEVVHDRDGYILYDDLGKPLVVTKEMLTNSISVPTITYKTEMDLARLLIKVLKDTIDTYKEDGDNYSLDTSIQDKRDSIKNNIDVTIGNIKNYSKFFDSPLINDAYKILNNVKSSTQDLNYISPEDWDFQLEIINQRYLNLFSKDSSFIKKLKDTYNDPNTSDEEASIIEGIDNTIVAGYTSLIKLLNEYKGSESGAYKEWFKKTNLKVNELNGELNQENIYESLLAMADLERWFDPQFNREIIHAIIKRSYSLFHNNVDTDMADMVLVSVITQAITGVTSRARNFDLDKNDLIDYRNSIPSSFIQQLIDSKVSNHEYMPYIIRGCSNIASDMINDYLTESGSYKEMFQPRDTDYKDVNEFGDFIGKDSQLLELIDMGIELSTDINFNIDKEFKNISTMENIFEEIEAQLLKTDRVLLNRAIFELSKAMSDTSSSNKSASVKTLRSFNQFFIDKYEDYKSGFTFNELNSLGIKWFRASLHHPTNTIRLWKKQLLKTKDRIEELKNLLYVKDKKNIIYEFEDTVSKEIRELNISDKNSVISFVEKFLMDLNENNRSFILRNSSDVSKALRSFIKTNIKKWPHIFPYHTYNKEPEIMRQLRAQGYIPLYLLTVKKVLIKRGFNQKKVEEMFPLSFTDVNIREFKANLDSYTKMLKEFEKLDIGDKSE